MTISTTESRAEYVGNGVSTAFTIPFRFLENSHIRIILVGVDGSQTLLVEGGNYSLSGADADDGGVATLVVAPVVGASLIIYRSVPATQETDYISGDPFPAESHERALDKLTMLVQQGEEVQSRTLKFPVGDLATQIGELPPSAQRANKLLSFDSQGRPSATAAIDQSATALQIALASTAGAGLIGFLQAGVGAVIQTLQRWMRLRPPTPYDFGAVGDGVADDTLALQRWLDYCYTFLKTAFLPAGYYAVRESSPGSGYALLNKGVSIVGEGRFYSQIVPLASMPNTADFIRVTPDDGAYIDYLELGRFSIYPSYGGVARGRHGVNFFFQTATNLSRLHIHDVYILPGNNYSIRMENNSDINFQGVPANTVIERNMFWEGVFLNKVGDSITIRNNVLRSTDGSNRVGVYAFIVTDVSSTASHLMLVENNIDCDGGAYSIMNGRNVKILYNNIELSHGSGTGSGAVVDIDGSSGAVPFAEIMGNHIGIFGTATPSSAIRINGALGASVKRNTILTGVTVPAAIFLTAGAADTDIGMNEISPLFTIPVQNGGVRTRGAALALGMLNGFTNTGGSYQVMSAFKSSNGQVTVAGVVNCPATPNGIVIAALPVGYRPTSVQRGAASAVVSGLVSGQACEVESNGNIVYYGNQSATRVEINITFPTLGYVAGSL